MKLVIYPHQELVLVCGPRRLRNEPSVSRIRRGEPREYLGCRRIDAGDRNYSTREGRVCQRISRASHSLRKIALLLSARRRERTVSEAYLPYPCALVSAEKESTIASAVTRKHYVTTER